MAGIILTTACLFIAILSFAYYMQTRIKERSKTDAERMLEQYMATQREGGKTTADDEEALARAQAKLLPSLGPLDKLAERVKTTLLRQKENELNGWLDRELMYAGLRSGDRNLTSYDVISYVIVYWSVVIISALFLVFVVQFPGWLGGIFAAFLLGYPFMRLRQLKNKRQDRIRFELPQFMDDLIANLATGQAGIDSALYAVIETNLTLPQRKRKILTEEFGQAFAEYRYAGRNQTEALRDISDRLGVDSVDEFVDLLVEGLATGYPIRDILIKQAKLVHIVWKQDMRAFIKRKRSTFIISVGLIALGVMFLFVAPVIIDSLSAAQTA